MIPAQRLSPARPSSAARLLLALVFALAAFGPDTAAAADERAFDLPAADLETALRTFGAQAEVQVIVPTELAHDVRTQRVSGRMSPQDALDQMLAGSELRAVPDEANGAFALVRRPPPAPTAKRRNAAAIIVVGLAIDRAQAARFWNAAETARDGLIARGVPPDAVTLVPSTRAANARRDAVAAAVSTVKPSVEEAWLIFFGNTGEGRDGTPTFQVSGPRITASDVASHVRALPGKKFVVIATAKSGAFLAPLAEVADVEAVAATAATGEVGEPRFAALWARELAAKPTAEFRTLAVAAAAQTAAFYAAHELAETEHAQTIDRPSAKIVEVSPDSAPQPTAAANP